MGFSMLFFLLVVLAYVRVWGVVWWLFLEKENSILNRLQVPEVLLLVVVSSKFASRRL